VRRAFRSAKRRQIHPPFISRHRTVGYAGALILIGAVALPLPPSRASWRLVRHRGGSCLGHTCPAGGRCLSTRVGYGRHWYRGNRAYSAIQSVNPCERYAHEQYHLPRRPRRDHPRNLGISRVALRRHEAPRTVPPAGHGGSSSFLVSESGVGAAPADGDGADGVLPRLC
jgi:hypothetical protein